MTASAWFNTGFSGVEESVQNRKDYREQQKSAPRRFFLKASDTKTVIFCDDLAFTFYEHKISDPADMKNTRYSTCIGAARGCPDCAAGHKFYLATAFTIIDRSVWVDNKGTEHKDEKKLLVLRDEASVELKKKLVDWQAPLKGLEVKISRVGQYSYATGNAFDVVRQADHKPSVKNLITAKAKGMDVDPYDYMKILAPKTPAQATSAAAVSTSSSSRSALDDDLPIHSPIGAHTQPAQKSADEDIPF